MAIDRKTFDELKKRKKPRQEIVKIYLEDGPVNAHRDAARLLARLEMNSKTNPKQLADARKRVDTTKAALDEVTMEFVFEGIGRKAYEALINEHPPTEEDHETLRKEMGKEGDKKVKADFSFDTFAPALIAASLADPDLSAEQVGELFEEWNNQELIELYQAAMSCNNTRRVAALGEG